MTYPPQGSDDGAPGLPESGPTPAWEQHPPYGPPAQAPRYGQPPYAQPPYAGPAPYGPPPQYGQQPQFGSPQYFGYAAPGQQFGPPAPAPAPKSRVGLIAALTGVVLIVIAAAVVLAMRLQPTVLDAASAERDVAAQFEQREGVAIHLDCPDDMEVRAGATYTCTGKTAAGEPVTLKLAITNAKTAAYTWTEP